ncbi:MAG: NAD-dependent epimerase/dehydratase family protein [Chlamydiia bacterium]|nr:NAD-dependent epimerase/dehydratase family protein [Chlamydiia bacterium]
MTKRIIVTKAGFIGFHLCQRLAAEGHVLLGIDNFNDYYSPKLKQDRALALKQSGVSILEGDICDDLNPLCRSFSPTHCVHLAAQAGVRYSLVNPEACIRSNIAGFQQVLELCRSLSCPLIYASSSSVYGRNEKIPFAESDPTDHPASLYGATKKSNELMAEAYHHLFHFPTIGLRFFTVYGPWGRPDMAYYQFAEKIMRDEPIAIYNNGQMERDFTYIDDIVDGIISTFSIDKGSHLFNLGNHQPIPLLRFITILEEALGKEALKEYHPMQPGDVVRTFADISHSQSLLGFSPRTTLEEGIPKFVAWYRTYHLRKKG